MILNRLVTTEGNTLRFRINHTVNGEVYELADGERYCVTFASEEEPEKMIMSISAPYSEIATDPGLNEGKYVFEVSVNNGTSSQVIMPALDERHKPLNQLIVLRRIGE